MEQFFENIGIIVFIAVIVMSVIFNTVSAKIKEAAAAAERSRDYQKKPHKFNPFSSESPEEFFERVREEDQSSKKLKLNSKHKKKTPPRPLQNQTSINHYEEPAHDIGSSSKTTKTAAVKSSNKIDITDKKALRKAIIINEVLSQPKAYDL